MIWYERKFFRETVHLAWQERRKALVEVMASTGQLEVQDLVMVIAAFRFVRSRPQGATEVLVELEQTVLLAVQTTAVQLRIILGQPVQVATVAVVEPVAKEAAFPAGIMPKLVTVEVVQPLSL
jgi:protein gp37